MNIIFTVGDCNGIGLECFFKALKKISKETNFKNVKFFIAGNKNTIYNYAKKCAFNFFNDNRFNEINQSKIHINNITCEIIDCEKYAEVELGKESKDAGRLAIASLKYAAAETLAGRFDAIVTLSVSKNVLYSVGWKFPGQTEFFANICGVQKPLMLLFLDNIRVALATIHIPLEQVSKNITQAKLIEIIEIFNHSLWLDFCIDKSKIAVLGLNPHAGENRSLGIEEEEIIKPAIEHCKKQGIQAEGPFSSDGFFGFEEYKKYDGILAMYHDQGLIPLKLLSNGNGVNFSAGLPIVRCSPDHGTGFAIAGKNLANELSTYNALLSAISIAQSRQQRAVDNG
ncbi:MAG TPA: 4-hydroxythreonine-4-phosphate dehydrogenase PdxA [Candidatus Kapabacteria bacterium]|nr:4-hydroxythreonine-4-phosphate dehydrogenase PdxA [Candidatus Kapabacteria bacterium]HPO63543.1 4-hydroxythreonine-4-phosphate dehydrogenase PdxA [Candidatus Kapabacteria bacterium]